MMSTDAPLASSGAGRGTVPHSEELLVRVRHCGSSKMDITLCYQCFGNPTDGNPVVLLVCGLNMQLYAWDEAFCEDLVRAGFFVIRYDNRDIGYSTKVESRGSVVGPRLLLSGKWASALGERLPYTLDDMAKDGLALLAALGIPRAHVLGISMGGSIAQCMALLAPEVVLSLTSIMSTTNTPDLPDPQLWVKLWMLRKPPKNCTIDELLDFRVSSLRRLLEHALPVDEAYLKERYLMSLNRSSYGAGLLRQAAAMRRCPGRDQLLRQLTIPALVVHGAQDLVVPPNHGYRTALVIPHARLLVLKSMGHYFHPAFFPPIIAAFADMASHTAGPGTPHPLSARPRLDGCGAGSGACAAAAAPTAEAASAPASPLMASLGALLRPVVATPASAVGAAAKRVVDVRVPRTGEPTLPEAVLLDLHAEDCAPAAGDEVVEAAPYVVGSSSIWNCATFPSPIRKTSTGGLVEARAAPQSVPLTGRVVPQLAGTPLDRVLAHGTASGTETRGGRRSCPPSVSHSRCTSFSGGPDGGGPGPEGRWEAHTSADALCELPPPVDAVNPQSRADAEDVAATLLPPLLPNGLEALTETLAAEGAG